MRIVSLIATLLCALCTQACLLKNTSPTGPEIRCFRQELPCYSVDDINEVMLLLSSIEPGFDPEEHLVVDVYDRDVGWDKDYNISSDPKQVRFLGYTPDDGARVVIISRHVLMHELFHVMFYRNTGDGDVNHEDPPGPWTYSVNKEIISLNTNIVDNY